MMKVTTELATQVTTTNAGRRDCPVTRVSVVVSRVDPALSHRDTF